MVGGALSLAPGSSSADSSLSPGQLGEPSEAARSWSDYAVRLEANGIRFEAKERVIATDEAAGRVGFT